MGAVNDQMLDSRAVGGFVREKPADARGRLVVDVSHRGGAVILEVRGELDAHTLPTWRRLVGDIAGDAAVDAPVVVDITRLDIIACGTLAAVAQQLDRYRARGVNLVVATRPSTIHRLTAAGDLAIRLPVYPSTQAALSAPVAENGGRGGEL